MGETTFDVEKKLATVRRLSSLAGCRREAARLYEQAKAEGGRDPQKISYYRALGYLLNTVAEILRNEKLEDIEQRLSTLEKAQGRAGK
ncbi:MAG: hypothetical protein BWX81_00587 [Spirochaetes bacterium ADurb.Bin110]|jgi:hypothetical protein|nr:MAG: hypothetical protein BWX81_00587 [Spirochaetes bacterium ADurb.Bin110]HNV35993.1 hypothetical protein [Rectinema sp.]